MAAAGIAPVARALGRLAERADLVRALGHAHCFGLPQRECVDGAGRPATARLAMAITHRGGLAFHRELHRSAEATSPVNRHVPSPSVWVRSAWTESVLGFPAPRGPGTGFSFPPGGFHRPSFPCGPPFGARTCNFLGEP